MWHHRAERLGEADQFVRSGHLVDQRRTDAP
jgi:hypothetical protein